jgi:5,10-methylenetetrahydromethanopterin reductase
MLTASTLTRLCKKGEEAGFDSIWISEDPYYRDGIPMTCLAAQSTSRVKIATCILNVYTKDPVYMAMAAATLDEVSRGRLILGVGRGVKSLIEGELHIPYGSPLAYTREYIIALRKLFAGESVTRDGRYVKLTNAKLHFDPVRKGIPILLAAMGPKTARLAGTYGDGVILNSCTSVKHAKFIGEAMRSAQRKAESGPLELAASLWVSIDSDIERAYESVRTLVGFLLSIPTFGEVFLEMSELPSGSLAELRKIFRWDAEVGDPMWHFAQAHANRMKELVDDRTVDALAVCGTVEDCRKRLREYYDAGVTTAIINPITPKTQAKIQALL